jgi:hypothetical protein
MAQAFRSDKLGSDRWKDELNFLTNGGAATLPNQRCPSCNASYTVLIRIGDDQNYCLEQFKKHLGEKCPKHFERYKICESRTGLAREEVVGED